GLQDEIATLEKELAAARRAGLGDVEIVDHAPLKSLTMRPCLRFPQQAQFHPLKYLAGLADCVIRRGGQIYPETHADRIAGGDKACVTVGKHTIKAKAIVVATNVPINDLVAIHTKQAPYMTYVIGAAVPAGSVPRTLYWDTADPYHYVRLERLAKDDQDN